MARALDLAGTRVRLACAPAGWAVELWCEPPDRAWRLAPARGAPRRLTGDEASGLEVLLATAALPLLPEPGAEGGGCRLEVQRGGTRLRLEWDGPLPRAWQGLAPLVRRLAALAGGAPAPLR